MGAAVGFTLTQSARAWRSPCSPRSASAWRCRSLLLSHFPARCSSACPSPARGWRPSSRCSPSRSTRRSHGSRGCWARSRATMRSSRSCGGLVLIAMAAWMYGRWEHASGTVALRRGGGARGRRARSRVAGDLAIPAATAPVRRARRRAALAANGRPRRSPSCTRKGQAGVRRFHRRLVRHLPGEQAPGAAQRRGGQGVRARAASSPLRADWTRQDPRITAALAALGRNAVPVYALYVPGETHAAAAARSAHAVASCSTRSSGCPPQARASTAAHATLRSRKGARNETTHRTRHRLRLRRGRARQRLRRANPRPPSPSPTSPASP